MTTKIMTADETKQAIKIANFNELINPILDRIDFISLEAAPQVFAQLDAELVLFNASGASKLYENPSFTLLKDLSDLLDPDNCYASPEDMPLLFNTLVKRLHTFARTAKAWTASELSTYIKQQQDRLLHSTGNNIAANILAQRISAFKTELSTEDRQDIKYYGINTNYPAGAKICIQANKISELEVEKICEPFVNLLHQQLALNTNLIRQLIAADSIEEQATRIKFILLNISYIFNVYRMDPNKFLALSETSKVYLLLNPMVPDEIMYLSDSEEINPFDHQELAEINVSKFFDTEIEELDFCLQCLYLYAIVNAEHFKIDIWYFKNANPEQLTQFKTDAAKLINQNFCIQFILDSNYDRLATTLLNAVKLCMHDRFSLSEVANMNPSFKHNILFNPKTVLDFLLVIGVSKTVIQNTEYLELVEIYAHKEKFNTLCCQHDLKPDTLINLPHADRLTVLRKSTDIIALCSDLNMSIDFFLTQNAEIISLLLSSDNNLALIKVLHCFYFISVETIFALSTVEFKQILSNPQHTTSLFNKPTSTYDSAEILACIDRHIQQQEQILQSFSEHMFLNSLSKHSSQSKALVLDLQKIGLPFAESRAIYEILIDINAQISDDFFAYFNPNSAVKAPTYSFNQQNLDLYFASELKNILIAKFTIYMHDCKQIVSKVKSKLDDFSQHGLHSYASAIMSIVDSAAGDQENVDRTIFAASTVIALAAQFKSLTTSIDNNSKSAKHLCLFKRIITCGHSQLVKKISSTNFKITMAKGELLDLNQSIINFYKSFAAKPTTHIEQFSDYAENSLFQVIHNRKSGMLPRTLQSESNYHRLSSKGLSYYAYAVQVGKKEILTTIQSWIRLKTIKDLSSFLFDYNLPSLQAQDQDGNTALHLAIQNGNYPIALAIIAREADFHIPNFAGKSPFALAKELHQHHVLQDMHAQAKAMQKNFLPAENTHALCKQLAN